MRQYLELVETDRWRFDEHKADRICRWMESLKLWEGEWAGHRMTLLPWQRRTVRDIFGWVDRKTGLRRFRYVYIEVPRKNGKTTFNAPIAAYCMMADNEPGAQVYSAAGDKEQASIIFKSCHNMLQAQSTLWKKIRPIESERTIIYPKKNSVFTALSRIADAKHGTNPHCVIYDELHVVKDKGLYRALDSGMGARRQPLMIMLTTAGYDRTTLCWEMHEYARKILCDELDDDRWYPVIYAADEADDWTDEATWAKANPSWEVTINPEHMRQSCKMAVNQPSEQNEFKRLRLNIWTNQSERWLDMDRWDICKSEPTEPLDGRTCYGGLDLSSTIDLSSLALVFPNEDGTYDVIWRTWTPEATIAERARRDSVEYDAWVRQGWLSTTPGERLDYRYIRDDIKALAEKYNIEEIAYDPWGASHLASELEEEDGITMVQCRQGFISLSTPAKELEALVQTGNLHHQGDPVARWCANNIAIVRDDADNIKPTKSKSSGRIDCIAALVTAMSRAMAYREAPKRSVYEDRKPYIPD